VEKLNGLPTEGRSVAEIREHYEVEKELAARLLATPRAERGRAYQELYDELFRRIPHHPQLRTKTTPAQRAREIAQPLAFLARFATPTSTYLEIGPGDCALAFAMADRVAQVVGVDVSEEITRVGAAPPNFRLIISDGTSVPLPAGSVDLAFSDQLIEHFHPDDTVEHFKLVRRLLKPGGVYVFRTPHRIHGPADVSRYFSDEPQGFHLKEWTYGEIGPALRNAGFSSWRGYWSAKGWRVRLPHAYFTTVEKVVPRLPTLLGRKIARILLPNLVAAGVK